MDRLRVPGERQLIQLAAGRAVEIDARAVTRQLFSILGTTEEAVQCAKADSKPTAADLLTDVYVSY